MTHNPSLLTPHLSVLQSRLFSYNAGVFLSDGEACLVDPGIYADEMDRIAFHVGEQNVSPESIVVTHSHWDHVLGPEYFPMVKLIQQAESLGVLAEYGHSIEHQVMEWERQSEVTRVHPFEMPEPDETFDKRMELRVGSLVLELLHAPGHAPEQLVVYERERGALWAGDMLSDLEIPFVMQSLAAYRSTLEMLAGLDVKALVPGHGSATADPGEIRRRLDEDRTYLAELQGTVEHAVKDGKAAEAAVAQCRAMRFRHRDENAHPHKLNVETAFLELGGKADGRIGWNRLQ
jgi:hydroxyacylglutathione hydrolase